MIIARRTYTTGQCRNEPKTVAHLYRGGFQNPGSPMCLRGWNRLDGFGYSIFRNLANARLCKVCLRRAEAKLDPVPSKARKTKWL